MLTAVMLAGEAWGATLNVRLVCYNIEADINGVTTPLPGLIAPSGGTTTQGGVLEGIGELAGGTTAARPIDILALEETTSNPTTIAPIVNGLNAYYSALGVTNAVYAMSTFQATESGGDVADGNGPNALVYNTQTLQLLSSIPVLPAGGTNSLGASSGEYREAMCYVFAPAGLTNPPASTKFYIYVSHYKSGTGTSVETARQGEAVIIRNHETTNCPADARVIYVGDYNITTSGEASYQTMLTPAAPNGTVQGSTIDPMNLTGATNIDWSANSNLAVKTDSSTTLHYRDDIQLMTTNIYYGTSNGLSYVAGSYHTFGNNGSIPYEGAASNSANTALSGIPGNAPISAANLYKYLTTASDHYPVVSDYTIVVPDPIVSAPFGVSTAYGAAPLAVTFGDNSTGTITNYLWNFGDGVTTNTSSATVAHTYNNLGTFTVTEVVTGPLGSVTNIQTNAVLVTTAYQAWQLTYFGCTNCAQAQTNADFDGTGQNNLFKYVAGLNPTNPASVFKFSIGGSNAVKNITFSPAVTGRSYAVQYLTNLPGTNWILLTNYSVSLGTNGPVNITDTNKTDSQRFYRVKISSP